MATATKKAPAKKATKKAAPRARAATEKPEIGWKANPGLVALHELSLAGFDDSEIGKKPQGRCYQCEDAGPKPWDTCNKHEYIECKECGQKHTSALTHVDFVGHADAWHRLLDIDPMATWEPLAFDEQGLPAIKKDGSDWSLWIKVKIHVYSPEGEVQSVIERVGVGTVKVLKTTQEPVKQLISDGVRNALMRQGVALDLWAKGDRAWNAEASNALAFGEAETEDESKPEPTTHQLDMDLINAELSGLESKQVPTVMKAARQSDSWKAGDTKGVIQFITSFRRTLEGDAPETDEEAVEKLQEEFPGSEEVASEKPKRKPTKKTPEPEPEPVPEPEEKQADDDPDAELKDRIRKLFLDVPAKRREMVMAQLKKDGLFPLTELNTAQLKKVQQRLEEEPF